MLPPPPPAAQPPVSVVVAVVDLVVGRTYDRPSARLPRTTKDLVRALVLAHPYLYPQDTPRTTLLAYHLHHPDVMAFAVVGGMAAVGGLWLVVCGGWFVVGGLWYCFVVVAVAVVGGGC